ncbi:MAG TPA: secretin N-terminal domain-containing protein [Thermoanaerobaculia bacterium]|nr:secretin N-terminal domain-containing protein [Thermoanaerobaculia bacterium]
MRTARPLALLVALAALGGWAGGTSPAAAQSESEAATLRIYSYRLVNQPAAEAIALVRPLMSQQGTVELQPRTNTIVIRDSLSALSRIVPVLRGFDHAVLPLRLEVLIVEAAQGGLSVPVEARPPEPLSSRLRSLFRYDRYEVIARGGLDAREGEDVTYELGQGYVVNFRLGTLLADQRIRLNGLRIMRAVDDPEAKVSPAFTVRTLLNGNFNLWLDQTLVLTLTQSESSPRALMVAVTCTRVKS